MRDSALLVDCEKSLTCLRKSVESLTCERDTAVSKYRGLEHDRDRVVEMFKKTDAEVHRLTEELARALESQNECGYSHEHDHGHHHYSFSYTEFEAQLELLREEKQVHFTRCTELEREKDAAVAKALEDYVAADKERDAAVRKYENMEDRFQKAEKQRAVLGQKLVFMEKKEEDLNDKNTELARELQEALEKIKELEARDCID